MTLLLTSIIGFLSGLLLKEWVKKHPWFKQLVERPYLALLKWQTIRAKDKAYQATIKAFETDTNSGQYLNRVNRPFYNLTDIEPMIWEMVLSEKYNQDKELIHFREQLKAKNIELPTLDELRFFFENLDKQITSIRDEVKRAFEEKHYRRKVFNIEIAVEQIKEGQNALTQRLENENIITKTDWFNTFYPRYQRIYKNSVVKTDFDFFDIGKQFRENREIGLVEIFVQPIFKTKKYEPLEIKDNQVILYNDLLQEIPHVTNILILGERGSGKSTLHQAISLDILEKKNNVVIRVELYKYFYFRDSKEQTLFNYITYIFGEKYELNHLQLKEILTDYTCYVFFDGFDEVYTDDAKRTVRNDIDNFLLDYPNIKGIVTSRPKAHDIASFAEERFCKLQLSPFNDEQVKDYINKWAIIQIAEEAEQQAYIEKAIPIISKFPISKTPLWLNISLFVHYSTGIEEIKSKFSLLERYVDKIIEWENRKNEHIKPNIPDYILTHQRMLLEFLAFQQYGALKSELSEEQIKHLIADFLMNTFSEIKHLDAAKEIAKDFNEYLNTRFTPIYVQSHFNLKIFHEFFTAFYIFNTYEVQGKIQERDDLVSQHIDEVDWFEPLKFLIEKIEAYQKSDINDLINTQLDRNEKAYVFFLRILNQGSLVSINAATIERLLKKGTFLAIDRLLYNPGYVLPDAHGKRHFREEDEKNNRFSFDLFNNIYQILSKNFNNETQIFNSFFNSLYIHFRNDEKKLKNYFFFYYEMIEKGKLKNKISFHHMDKIEILAEKDFNIFVKMGDKISVEANNRYKYFDYITYCLKKYGKETLKFSYKKYYTKASFSSPANLGWYILLQMRPSLILDSIANFLVLEKYFNVSLGELTEILVNKGGYRDPENQYPILFPFIAFLTFIIICKPNFSSKDVNLIVFYLIVLFKLSKPLEEKQMAELISPKEMKTELDLNNTSLLLKYHPLTNKLIELNKTVELNGHYEKYNDFLRPMIMEVAKITLLHRSLIEQIPQELVKQANETYDKLINGFIKTYQERGLIPNDK